MWASFVNNCHHFLDPPPPFVSYCYSYWSLIMKYKMHYIFFLDPILFHRNWVHFVLTLLFKQLFTMPEKETESNNLSYVKVKLQKEVRDCPKKGKSCSTNIYSFPGDD